MRYIIFFSTGFSIQGSVGGLVVKSVVAIDGPRVRFPADASEFSFLFVISSFTISPLLLLLRGGTLL